MKYRWMENLPIGEDLDEMTANLIALEIWVWLAEYGRDKGSWRDSIPYEAGCPLCSYYKDYSKDDPCSGCCLDDTSLCYMGVGEAYTRWSARVRKNHPDTKSYATKIADAIQEKCISERWI